MLKHFEFPVILLFLLALGVGGCKKAVIPQIVDVQEDVPELPLVIPDEASDSLFQGLARPVAVMKFYRGHGQRPGWVEDERTNVLGDSLISFIRNIRYYGLLPQSYHLGELTRANRTWWRPEARLRRDVLLTDAFLSIAADLRFGRLSASRADTTGIALLGVVLDQGALKAALERQQPDFVQYHDLRRGLERFILNADSTVRSSLMSGATVDSLLVHRKVRTIEINLERWRWERNPWAERYIYVNIPSYTLEVIDNGRIVLDSRAIVGKPDKATPAFSSMMQCFVTYPYWHVPRKISVEEFLPAIQRDTSFITRNNFDVLDRKGHVLHPDSLDWKSFSKDNFPVVLRQREGRENSLGILKFVFDNPYAVFVHDTNAPRLFRQKSRAFSHGCIRIEKAQTLAHYLVTGQVGTKASFLESYLDQKIRHTVDLPSPVPIHIRYFTASTDRHGRIVFFEDVYGKDPQMIQQLYRGQALLTWRTAP